MTVSIALFAGIRPQFIKASVLREAAKGDGRVRLIVVNAGQHYSPELVGGAGMKDFDVELPVRPELGDMQHQIRARAEELLFDLRSEVDWCVVMGDADCSLSVARAAQSVMVATANVEAGIRGPSGGPESSNALEIDRLSLLRLAASEQAMLHLQSEGLSPSTLTGDLYLDFVLAQEELIDQHDPVGSSIPYILVSGHHLASAEVYHDLIEVIASVARTIGVRTVAIAHPKFGTFGHLNAEVIAPLRHLDLLGAMNRAQFVVTDSGGMQREAYYMGKRCVLLQDRAWWPELVDGGAHATVGTDRVDVADGVAWAATADPFVPDLVQFGGGRAAPRILDALCGTVPS